METVVSPFSAWESFYVIVGSSAAALTGLQFVVITLSSEARTLRTAELSAFGTPTIVHFCTALLVSAILSSPWETLSSPALTLSLTAAWGIAYAVIVTWRTVRQKGYKPELEDWLWHVLFPLLAYVALLVAAFQLTKDAADWLFTIAAVALILLFIGIHNAWDAVTYIAMTRGREPEAKRGPP